MPSLSYATSMAASREPCTGPQLLLWRSSGSSRETGMGTNNVSVVVGKCPQGAVGAQGPYITALGTGKG